MKQLQQSNETTTQVTCRYTIFETNICLLLDNYLNTFNIKIQNVKKTEIEHKNVTILIAYKYYVQIKHF